MLSGVRDEASLCASCSWSQFFALPNCSACGTSHACGHTEAYVTHTYIINIFVLLKYSEITRTHGPACFLSLNCIF